jgi:hypothetical protein
MSMTARVGRGVVATTLSLAVLGATVVAVGASMQQVEPFPHERHEGLFPLCTGCHEGVTTSDRAEFYPEPGSCDGCHDGNTQVEVSWSPPEEEEEPGFVRFDHAVHSAELEREGEPAQACASCHAEPGGGRMSVAPEIQLDNCWQCHAESGADHMTEAPCATCHVPLAESELPLWVVEAIPAPPDHDGELFLLETHGGGAQTDVGRCATCHTADRCAACHVDPNRPEIEAIGYAPEGMELPVLASFYPEPANHDEEGWFDEHGTQASQAQCATCHTRDDCASCHIQPVPAAVTSLPSRSQSLAPGVGVEGHAPESHESVFFTDVHTALAAAEPGNCATCHAESFCVQCHDGPADGGYHPAGFVARHSAAAFGREAECASCHSTEAFCRACHAESGLLGVGRLGPGYHAAGAFWLIRHGQAARQGLESCITCHEQSDCTQCHGAAAAFKVSPHSRDFDARRAWERNPRTCFGCHIRNPLDGRVP